MTKTAATKVTTQSARKSSPNERGANTGLRVLEVVEVVAGVVSSVEVIWIVDFVETGDDVENSVVVLDEEVVTVVLVDRAWDTLMATSAAPW
jgi:hypothetical protein